MDDTQARAAVPERRRPLQVGLHLPHAEGMMDGQTPRWGDILAMARLAEDVGFDSLWVMDHLLLHLPGWEDDPAGVWEGWSMLAALAAATTRIALGPFVACTSFRNPALLAKTADTLDEISGGRLILGLGAGWHAPEYAAFGYPYDHRVSRFAEAFAIIRSLLREGHVDFDGTYYSARDCELRPRGPRSQGPPLVVGTTGPRMLRVAVPRADGWSAEWTNGPGAIPPLRAVVDAACQDAGRDPATLGRMAGVLIDLPGQRVPPREDRFAGERAAAGPPATGSPEELAQLLREYAAEGISHIVLWIAPATPGGIEAFAPVLQLLDAD